MGKKSTKKKKTTYPISVRAIIILLLLSLSVYDQGHRYLSNTLILSAFLVTAWALFKKPLKISRKIKYWRLKDKIKLGVYLNFLLYFIIGFSSNDFLRALPDIYLNIFILGLFLFGMYKLISFTLGLIRLLLKGKEFSVTPIEEIDKMDGTEFERFLANLYEYLGYFTELTPNNDFGADIILIHNKTKTVVQAKCYGEGQTIGVKAINEVVGGAGYYNAYKKIVITNHYFTEPAKKTAYRNDVKLIDREGLLILLNEYRNKMINKKRLRDIFKKRSG